MTSKHAALLAMLPQVEGNPAAMVALARQMMGGEDRAVAVDLATRALALSDSGEIDILARDVISDGVPQWHFMIVRDQRRNKAYEDALMRAVTPGCRVLEIGAGSGLLAMMAARGGAEVITCEMEPAVAAVARDIVATNGFSDRVRVINKHSTALTLEDLGGHADILVSEIVSNDLLSEGVLPAHEDAVRRLLRPGATVIPLRGRIRIALVDVTGRTPRAQYQSNGFDLSALHRVSRPSRDIAVDSDRLIQRSASADLLEFDFASPGPWRAGRTTTALESTGGQIQGVFQWIALDMDAEETYENSPEFGLSSCWGGVYWEFPRAVFTEKGQRIGIGARYEADRIWIWGE